MKYSKIFIAFILCVSCLQNKKNLDYLEQKVFGDIFQELLEKTVNDFRKLPIAPSPPKDNSNEEKEK